MNTINDFQLHRHFQQNTIGKDYVVGDIHGYYRPLMQALELVSFDKSRDRLFALGDLVDRGPDSLKCLGLLAQPWFFSVLGNHEYELVTRFGDGSAWLEWLRTQATWLAELPSQAPVVKALELILQRMPLSISVAFDEVVLGLVHAQSPAHWPPTKALTEQGLHKLLWGRREFNAEDEGLCEIEGVDMVVMGHNSSLVPVIKPQRLWIDTFASAEKFLLFEVNAIASLAGENNVE
ncbi:metallophosphoesterase [Agarivorans gilvus]|uniref:Serine/threonine protein phosphatase n=1 Tax=Agarivorans gilvus TaxID=680279 RepID=A0ABQ1I0Q5_9ALTE|nr:metallophosphoesterase [Agarivorans gilvus]GGB05367.1 serine/threonine protein phosphatase [Agarivorans gilvus]